MALIQEIQRLKEEIAAQRQGIQSVQELVNEKIDKDFFPNLWDLSGKELDQEMGIRLTQLNKDCNPHPQPATFSSHRRVIGKILILSKRLFFKLFSFYSNTLMEKQHRFNLQASALYHCFYIRFQQMETKFQLLQEKLAELEDHEILLMEGLDNPQSKAAKKKHLSGYPSHPQESNPKKPHQQESHPQESHPQESFDGPAYEEKS